MRVVEVGLGGALGLGAGRVARALAGPLKPLRPLASDGARVLVMGEEVARALGEAGMQVVLVMAAERARRRARGLEVVEAIASALPFAEGSLAAAVIARLDAAALEEALDECARVVEDGGPIVVASPTSGLVRKPAPPEVLSAALLRARLVNIEQRMAGATLLSLARVRRAAAIGVRR